MRSLAGAMTGKRRWAVLGMAVAAGLAGCGGDNTLAVGEPKADAAAYCAKSLAIETSPEPAIDFESATPEQLEGAAKAYAAGLLPLAEEAAGLAPAAIKSDIDLLVATTRTVAQTGDFEAFESDAEVSAAGDRVHAFDLDNCGWGKADITATEYEFSDIPKLSEAGPVSFDLTNDGKEAHHLIIFSVNEGVDLTVEELLKLPEEEVDTKVKMVAEVEPVEPGASDYTVVNLTAGRYGMACFLPVGGGEEGPPHVTEGMFGQLKVV